MLKFPVLSFLGAAALFFTATLTAGIYGFSASKLNLWLALGLTLALNPLGLNGKRTAAWGLCAGIAAAGAFALPAQIWSVWIFAAFLAAGGLLKRLYDNDGMPNNEAKNGNSGNEKATEYGRLIILAAAYFNLSFITNTGHTDVQYDFASCFNYIEYILENNFLFWQENPLLTRPSYSTYHPILHFLLAAGEMRLATVLETGMLNAELPAMGAGANMQLAAEATQVCFCFYMLWYYFLAGKFCVSSGFPGRHTSAGWLLSASSRRTTPSRDFSTTTACCCRYRREPSITPCSITVTAGGKIWHVSCCLPPRQR